MRMSSEPAAGAPPPALAILATALAGAALSGTAVAVTLSGGSAHAGGWDAIARGLIVAVPVAVGLYSWGRRPGDRFGPLLLATGFACFLTTLAESSDEVLYSIGRVSGWVVEIALVYLILSFPSGRLSERIDRVLTWATAILVATLYVPAALIAERFPTPSPYSSCDAACPDNAFFLLGSEPAVVESFVRPLRELLAILLFLAITARLAQRVRRASPVMRRTLSPVLVVAIARVFVLALALGTRRVAPESAAVDVFSWMIALAIPAIAAGSFLGLLRWRLFEAQALHRLGLRLRAGLDPDQLRVALADALDDPSVRLGYWTPARGGQWVDGSGRPLDLPPAPTSGRWLTEVREGDRLVAGIVHDVALRDRPELIEDAVSYARLALENQRLSARVESSLSEVRESRARISAAADAERRRIERDLHDGAQQRLVALRIKLELAEELTSEGEDGAKDRLHALGEEVEATLDEIRDIAHGVYPSLLADAGLREALRAAAMRVPTQTTLELDGLGRHPDQVESAVYFCCLEALQNASKHALGASEITIALSEDDALYFEVRDDGSGFDRRMPTSGNGLTNMRDRLAAVGGELAIESSPGHGTVVSGSVPLDGVAIARP